MEYDDRRRRRHGSRDRHRDSRSRSRSKERSSRRDSYRDRSRDRRRRSRSYSRSRSRSPPKPRAPAPALPPTVSAGLSAFGVPATGVAPAPPQGQAGMGVNPMIATMLQQAVGGAGMAMAGPVPDKTELELFVGNTPQGTSEFVLLNFLNAAMQQVKLNTSPGAPIVQCRVSQKFAFIELRSKQEATNALNLTGIPFMGVPLKIGRPSKYRGPPTPSSSWQALTGQVDESLAPAAGGGTSAMPGSASGLDPATKVYRELYIGNCTPLMAEGAVAEFLGATLQKVGLATPEPGNPVVICRSSGNYCFVEMRSIEDANAMLNLNGVPFMGNMLKISRPSKYPGPMTPHMSWPDVLARVMAQGDPSLLAAAAAGAGAPAPAANATRVLRLNNMLSEEDLGDEEGLADIEDETKTECGNFGVVRTVHIVRPSTTDASMAKASTGVGYVFVEFDDVDSARKAMLSLSTRTFDGKRVEVTFWDENKFAQGAYGDGSM